MNSLVFSEIVYYLKNDYAKTPVMNVHSNFP